MFLYKILILWFVLIFRIIYKYHENLGGFYCKKYLIAIGIHVKQTYVTHSILYYKK